jgi:integrase
MAYVDPYEGKRGTRYRGYYRDPEGKRKSVGTFETHDEAMQVALEQEAWTKGQQERTSPQQLATTTLEEYVPQFLRLANVEDVTRGWYAGLLRRHVLPRFGSLRLAEISPEQVAHWLVDQRDAGYSPRSLQAMRTALSAVLKQAANYGYARGNAASGAPIPRMHRENITVVTVEQFQEIWRNLPTEGARLYAQLIVFTGLRQGEAMALTPRDIDVAASVINVTKAWTEPGRANNTESGQRFRLNQHTKHGGRRRIGVKKSVINDLLAWIDKHNIPRDGLIFTKTNVHAGATRKTHSRGRKYYEPLTPDRIATLGTVTAANGKEYQHGTLGGYTTAKCKCDPCRQWASEYSATRKAIREGKPVPDFSAIADKIGASPAYANPHDVMGRSEWRDLWQEGLRKADLGVEQDEITIKASQLRHTHASWMVNIFGASPQDMCQRLGHSDLSITERYINQVGTGADNAVADRMELTLDMDLGVGG